MKHIRTFESYKTEKVKLKSINKSAFVEAIKESVLQVGDIYKVRSMVDIPQSLINSYVKKVKDSTGKNLRQFFGDVEIAEELLKYITISGLDLEKIPGNALMGGAQGQTQGQGQGQAQGQGQGQAQGQGQGQVQVDTQAEGQGQTQGQGQDQGQFEEPQGQAQGQGQGQAQGQGQGQAQGQGQGQTQGQGQAQEEGEEGEEELPL